jgi:hypothetical protein
MLRLSHHRRNRQQRQPSFLLHIRNLHFAPAVRNTHPNRWSLVRSGLGYTAEDVPLSIPQSFITHNIQLFIRWQESLTRLSLVTQRRPGAITASTPPGVGWNPRDRQPLPNLDQHSHPHPPSNTGKSGFHSKKKMETVRE